MATTDLGITLSVGGAAAAAQKLSLFRRSVDATKNAVHQWSATMHSNSNALAQWSVGMGIASMALIAAGRKMSGAIGSSIDKAREFELEIANLKYSISATDEEMRQIEKTAVDMGTSSLYSADKVAKAWYNLASAGLQGVIPVMGQFGEEQKNISELALKSTLNYATMTRGTVDLGKAADTTVALVNKLGLSFESAKWTGKGFETELERVYDRIAMVSKLTRMRPEEIPTILDSLRAAPQLSGSTVSEILAMTAALQQMGYSSAEAGQHINAMVRSRMIMGGKYLQRDMYAKLRSALPHTRTGSGSSMRGRRAAFFIDEVFGSRAEFDKAFKDAEGNFTSMLSFMAKIEEKMAQKGMGTADTSNLMLKLFGSSAVAADYLLLAKKYKFTHPTEKDSSGKSVVYEGLAGLKKLSETIENSRGESEKYAEAMAKTAWGIKQVKDAALDTFKIVFGQTVLPILSLLLRGLTTVIRSFTNFLKDHPRIAQAFGLIATAITGATIAVAGFLGLFVLSAFSVAKFRAGFASVAKSIAEVSGNATLMAKSVNIAKAAEGGMFAKGTMLGRAAEVTKNFFSLGKGLRGFVSFIGRIAIVPAVVITIVESIDSLIEHIRILRIGFIAAFKPAYDFHDWIVIQFRKIRAIVMALFTGDFYAEDIVELGDEFKDVSNFLSGDFGNILRNIALIFNDISAASKDINDRWSAAKKKPEEWTKLDFVLGVFRSIYDLMPPLGKAMLLPLGVLLNFEEIWFKLQYHAMTFGALFEALARRLVKIWDAFIVLFKKNFLKMVMDFVMGAPLQMLGVPIVLEFTGLSTSIENAFKDAFPNISSWMERLGGVLGKVIGEAIKFSMTMALGGPIAGLLYGGYKIVQGAQGPNSPAAGLRQSTLSKYTGSDSKTLAAARNMLGRTLSAQVNGSTANIVLHGDFGGGLTEEQARTIFQRALNDMGYKVEAVSITRQ